MNSNQSLKTLVFVLALAFASVTVSAQTEPDNTKINERDRVSTEMTADQQKSGKGDLEVSRRIREDLMKDAELSTYAHNIKIIASHGKVTLKGPVHTKEEKESILKYARAVAGAGNVINRIDVVPEKK